MTEFLNKIKHFVSNFLLYYVSLFAIQGSQEALHITQTIHTKLPIKGTSEFGITCPKALNLLIKSLTGSIIQRTTKMEIISLIIPLIITY